MGPCPSALSSLQASQCFVPLPTQRWEQVKSEALPPAPWRETTLELHRGLQGPERRNLDSVFPENDLEPAKHCPHPLPPAGWFWTPQPAVGSWGMEESSSG